jgi:hypothetical protein
VKRGNRNAINDRTEQQLKGEFGRGAGFGLPKSALLTNRIAQMTEHLKLP